MQVLVPNPVARETLKRGDHIYAYRQGYEPRHGIYDGEGQVIHYIPSHSNPSTLPCPQCGPNPNPQQGITTRCLRCFLAGSGLYLFQYAVSHALFIARVRGGTCTLASSDPTDEVMHRALHLLQNGAVSTSHGFFENGCEDFAVYCKTGLLVVGGGGADRSGHAVAALTAAAAVAASPLRYLLGYAGSAVVGVGVHCAARMAEDISVRRDVIKDAVKVPVELLISGSGF